MNEAKHEAKIKHDINLGIVEGVRDGQFFAFYKQGEMFIADANTIPAGVELLTYKQVAENLHVDLKELNVGLN